MCPTKSPFWLAILQICIQKLADDSIRICKRHSETFQGDVHVMFIQVQKDCLSKTNCRAI